VFTFITEYENYSFNEAMKMLADRAGVSLPEQPETDGERRERDIRSRILEINKLAAVYFVHQLKGDAGHTAMEYFGKRKLTQATINSFGLGYSGIHGNDLYLYLKGKGYNDDILKETGLFTYSEKGVTDKFWNRVMYPIMDVNNHVIGFGGRVMGDGKPKYLNSPETKAFDKSRNLYGLNYARKSRKPNLIICEGYMDVIAMHQAGFNQAVASLGTALTEGQASLMKRYTDNVLITYDSDNAGVMAALRAIPILKAAGLNTRVINMKPYKDPDEFIKALGAVEFQKRIDGAQNSFMYEIAAIKAQYDLDDPGEKTRFHREISRRLATFGDILERNNYIGAVAREYGIDEESLRQMVNGIGNQMAQQQEADKPVRVPGRREEKDDGMALAQKLLLTWMAQDADVFLKVAEYLSAEDFDAEPFHQVAVKLYEQLEKGSLNPAAIIGSFPDSEDQRLAASVFSQDLDESLSAAEREKTLNDIVRKIKKKSLIRRQNEETDPKRLMELIGEQKKLQSIQIHL
jgi:DNA primase